MTRRLGMSDSRAPTHINLAEKLDQFSEHWSPKIVARYNDNEVRLVKTEGEWVWHKHDETDELFLILEGEFDMDFRDRTVTVKPGELLIVPRGTEHRPAARRGEVSCCSSTRTTRRTPATRQRRRKPSSSRGGEDVQSRDGWVERCRPLQALLRPAFREGGARG